MGRWKGIAGPNPVCGAVSRLAPHPTNASILYAGAVNGGVWRTTNATAVAPTWTPLTDQLASPSIGALEFDPTDASNQTLVAGIGRLSSFGGVGGALTGIQRTTDGGNSWTELGQAQLTGRTMRWHHVEIQYSWERTRGYFGVSMVGRHS